MGISIKISGGLTLFGAVCMILPILFELSGKTPAQKAKINVVQKNGDKWMNLLEFAVKGQDRLK